jgi:hypothetical protein
MTKTELQIALAAATQTDKRTAEAFLDTLSSLAYRTIKKEGEFVLARLWQVGKAKREGSHLSNLPIPGSVDSVLPIAILLGLLRRMSTMNL